MKRNANKILHSILFAVLLILVLWTMYSRGLGTRGKGYTDANQLSDKTIGVAVGATFEDTIRLEYPDATIKLFSSTADMIQALYEGKIDAFAGSRSGYYVLHETHPEILALEPKVASIDVGYCFSGSGKGEQLLLQMDEYLEENRDTQEYQQLVGLWISEGMDDPRRVIDRDGLSGENGTIVVAMSSTKAPFSYRKDGEFVGFEVAILYDFCRQYGYIPKIVDVNEDGLFAGLTTGIYDMGCGGIIINEERKRTTAFSEPSVVGSLILMTYDMSSVPASNPIEGIRDSFTRTFLKDHRWRLLAAGMGTTLMITFVSAVLGLLLGFAMYRFPLVWKKDTLIYLIENFVRLTEDMPMVLFLMILFYIVFTGLDGIPVAVIGCTLLFGADVYLIFQNRMKLISEGEREAAKALGYTEKQSFYLLFLPGIRAQLANGIGNAAAALLKSTAVVGYIAVNDLTKMSDLIRSYTYEAFFPLLTTAFIYFVMMKLVLVIVKWIVARLDPAYPGRKTLMKGIESYDNTGKDRKAIR